MTPVIFRIFPQPDEKFTNFTKFDNHLNKYVIVVDKKSFQNGITLIQYLYNFDTTFI